MIPFFNNLFWCNLPTKGTLVKFLSIVIVSTYLVISITPIALGQFFLPTPSSTSSATYQTPWWNPNKAEPCGRLWCSQVWLFGRLDNILTVASEPLEKGDAVSSAIAIEDRAKLAETIYRSIYNEIKKELALNPENSLHPKIDKNLGWQDLLDMEKSLGIHPATPKVEIGIKNDQTVIFVPEQTDLGLTAQTIITVNTADSLHQGKTISEIAQQWRTTIYHSFSEALWGDEFDTRYPFIRLKWSFLIGFVVLIPIIILGIFRHFLKIWYRRLRQQLRELRDSLTIDAESLSSDQIKPSIPEIEEKPSLKSNFTWIQFKSWLKGGIQKPDQAIAKAKQAINTTVHNLSHNLPQLSLKQQEIIKNKQNIAQLVLQLFFWLQIFLLLLAITFIVIIFPETRHYSSFFLGQTFFLPLIWMCTSIANKISDLLIDYYLGKWAKEAQLNNPNSNRYILRVSTYSTALKGATTLLFIIVGIIATIMLFGIDPTVLAGVGGVAFVLAFLSRNLVEDMLNGALILWTDRYAIGDVIQVGTISGLVEDMNIYSTQIRGDEGRLVTIPNSKIVIVENLTKDWSRVEFTIQIAYDEDIRKALSVIRQVSQDLFNDPKWKEKIIEMPSILGVDSVSHEGILIQVWIKTQAMEQWTVGREFRLRIKEAFETTKIRLGIPQRAIVYQTPDQPQK